MRLICLPHAGGSVQAYRTWRPLMPPHLVLAPIEPPGHGVRSGEPLLDTLDAVIDDLLARYADLFADGPYAIFGHSFGGLVGYELARRLMAQGQPGPKRMFVSAASPPSQMAQRDRHLLNDDDFIAEISALGATHPLLFEDPESRAFFLPPLRADMRAVETYDFEIDGRLAAPLTAIAAVDDPLVDPAAQAGWDIHGQDVRHAWTSPPAGHMYLESHAAWLVHTIALHLAEA